MLIDTGARQTAEMSPSAMALATARGHVAILKMLLADDCGARQGDETSQNALQIAARNGNKEMVEMLLASGATDWDGSAVRLAEMRGFPETHQLLLDAAAACSNEK